MTTSLLLRGRALLLVLLALAVPMSALAAGENYGRVSGYVYDPTGTPLAEVPLTISGPALQQPISRTSGEDGRFEFGQVPPGEGYVLEVAVEGFTPIKKTGIIVRLGQNTPVDVKLEVLTETQAVATYEIVEKVNPIINPDSAQTGAVLTAEKVASTPIFNQVQAIPQLVAGVGPGNAPSSRGGLSRWGKFYVDGMDTTDVSDGSITATMNYYAVENFEVITGGLDAQYNSLGMIENVVTKSGSNEFTYDVSLILSPSWGNAKAQYASNQGTGTGNYVQNTAKQAETSFYAPLVAFGGPIVKDRLWFYASGQWNLSHKETPLTINGAQENRPKDTQTKLARLKLTWQPTSKDRVSFAVNVDNNTITNNISNADTALDAESRINRGGYFLIGNYDHNFTDNVLFQLQTGATYKNVYLGPQNDNMDAISHADSENDYFTTGSSGSLSSSVPGNYSTEDKWRFQFDPTLLFKAGAHQMKAGVQLGYLSGTQEVGTTGNVRYTDVGGICNPDDPSTFAYCNTRTLFFNQDKVLGANTTSASVAQLGAFFQDRWTVNRQLTVMAGLRADVARLYADDSTFITNLVGIGPRLSATYDITGDRKTLLKAHYGRSNEMGDVYISQHANPAIYQVTSTFDKAANIFPDCTPDTTTLKGCRISGGASGRYFDKTHTPPSVDEISLGLHREVAEGAVIGADLTYRRYNNLWIDEEVNQIWDPTGTRIVGYVDGQNHSVFKITNPDDAWRDYKGIDLWTQGKLGRWDLLASYTLAFSNGTVGSYFDGYGSNPRMKYLFEGPTPDDIRHTIKGSVGYATTFGLDFGIRFRYLTGTPLWMNQNQSNPSTVIYRSPRGTGYAFDGGSPNFNDPSTISELRNPDQFIIDAQARYDVGRLFQMKNKLELTMMVVNALNNTDANTLYDRWSPGSTTYGMARYRTSPLQAELLLRFRN
ncbi:TonB-dependent receptor [Archangium violaceum]|uniref:TonB-dependent receptor n=1 Tax=Archangium violaceum TaxID=83451 RepID=UPI00193BD745|nr:TonB-dependent receptor [Archangium violaceum]QRK11700.1 TonB-dependent receptor [Archangium violaceum]